MIGFTNTRIDNRDTLGWHMESLLHVCRCALRNRDQMIRILAASLCQGRLIKPL
jgi:hypothetical protein